MFSVLVIIEKNIESLNVFEVKDLTESKNTYLLLTDKDKVISTTCMPFKIIEAYNA